MKKIVALSAFLALSGCAASLETMVSDNGVGVSTEYALAHQPPTEPNDMWVLTNDNHWVRCQPDIGCVP